MADSAKPLLYRYLFIVVLLLTVYGNTLNHGFVWDDINIIVDSPVTESLRNIPRFFVMEDTAEGPTGYYRPITYVSFTLDRAVWGLNPVGYNITNLLLHVFVALLFFRVVAALFKKEDLAFYAALLFSLHPIVGETVNFHAGGRNTLLCACFSLASLLFYVKRKQLPALAFFILAVFSKEFGLLLPALFLMYDLLISREKPRYLWYIPYVIASASYLVIRSYAVHKHANLLTSINIADNIWILPRIFTSYLANMAWPFQLATMYDVSTRLTWFSLVLDSLILLGMVCVAFIFRKRREVAFSVVIFLLFLLPVSNLFPLGITMMADRYAYFALFGFSLGLAYCVSLASRRIGVAVMVALCVLFMTIDVKRNGIWKDEVSFFTQMAKDAPELSVGFQNLGYAYYDKGDYPNADKYLTEAYGKKEVNTRMLIGSASMFWDMKKLDKAILALKRKMELEPTSPESYIMASKVYEQMGDKANAKIYRDKAVALYPGIFEMMEQRTLSSCQQGEEQMAQHKIVAAERLFKEALNIDPVFVPALIDMGSLSAEKGDLAAALRYFTKAAELDPANPAVHYNLAAVYDGQGKGDLARQETKKFQDLEALSKQKPNAGK
jgi:protein O-mannosyl-transferase